MYADVNSRTAVIVPECTLWDSVIWFAKIMVQCVPTSAQGLSTGTQDDKDLHTGISDTRYFNKIGIVGFTCRYIGFSKDGS
jgi:hypothetical protein